MVFMWCEDRKDWRIGGVDDWKIKWLKENVRFGVRTSSASVLWFTFKSGLRLRSARGLRYGVTFTIGGLFLFRTLQLHFDNLNASRSASVKIPRSTAKYRPSVRSNGGWAESKPADQYFPKAKIPLCSDVYRYQNGIYLFRYATISSNRHHCCDENSFDH